MVKRCPLQTEVDGEATNREESTLSDDYGHDELMLMKIRKAKHTMPLSVQQTGEALQEFPPTPMTEMGLQLTPTRAVMGPSTIPSKLRRRLTNGSSCYAKW